LVVIQTQEVETDQGTALDVSIQFIEPGSEPEVLQAAMTGNPDATVTVFTAGENATTTAQLERLASDGSSIQIIEMSADRLASETQALVQNNPRFKDHPVYQRLQEQAKKPPRFEKLRNAGKGILITLGTASSFGGSYYLLTSDIEMSAKLFTMALVLNGFQIMATSLWQKYLRFGGTVVKKFHQAMAKIIGKTVQTGRVSEGIGRVLAAYGFNLAAATAVINIQEAQVSAWWIMALGAVGTWDAIWDLVFDRHVEMGTIQEKTLNKFIKYRLLFAPSVEAVAYSAGPFALGAAAVMAVIGGAGLISFFTAQHMREALDRRRAARAAKNILKQMETGDALTSPKAWDKLRRLVKGKPSLEKVNCDELLTPKEDKKNGHDNDQASSLPPSKTRTSWPSLNWIEAGLASA